MRHNHTVDIKVFPSKRQARFAIVFSGGSRTFYESWPNLYRHLIERNDIDVYITLKIPPNPSYLDLAQFQMALTDPKVRLVHLTTYGSDDSWIIEQAKNTTNPSYPYWMVEGPAWGREGLIIQSYLNREAFMDVESLLAHWGWRDYDLVVRVRGDLNLVPTDRWINLTFINQVRIQKNLTTPNGHFFTCPDMWRDPADRQLTDQIGFLSHQSAAVYYRVIEFYEQYCAKEMVRFHPEFALMHHMKRYGIMPYMGLERFYDGITKDSPEHLQAGSYQFGPGEFYRYCLRRYTGGCNENFQSNYPNEHGETNIGHQ